MIKSRIDFKNDHFIVHNKYLHCGDRNVQHFVGLKANVSQENRVLCHVLRQFSMVLLQSTVHLRKTFESVLRLNFYSDNPALRLALKTKTNDAKLLQLQAQLLGLNELQGVPNLIKSLYWIAGIRQKIYQKIFKSKTFNLLTK